MSLLDPLDPVSAFDDEEEASSAAAASKTRLTEEEAALGLEAAKAFKEGRLQEALRALEKVGESRPGDFLAAMNLIVTKYEIGELDVGKAMRELEDIFNDANTGKNALKTFQAKKNVTFFFKGGDFEDGEKLGLVYNLSLAYFLRRQFVKSGNLLKRVGIRILRLFMQLLNYLSPFCSICQPCPRTPTCVPRILTCRSVS